MYKEVVRKIELGIDEADLFQLFEYLKTLAVINKALILQGEDNGVVEGCIERVQERIVFIKIA